MRLTDDRYVQERQRLELGLRLLRREARSGTIRQCTGMSEDRIRKLYRTYLQGQTPARSRRKRGRAPQESSLFLRNTSTHLESSLLAGALQSLELAVHADSRPQRTMLMAERCCDAFDYYRQLLDDPQLCFEHAWLLMLALQRGVELVLRPCSHCRAPVLQDLFARCRPCPFCDHKPG